MIRIRTLHRKQADALGQIIQKAANRAAMSEDQVVLAVTHVLELIADEVARGRAISIPGFGMFAQCGPIRKGRQTWKPCLIPSRAWRLQVRLGTRPDPTVRRQVVVFQQNSSRMEDNGTRPFSVMDEIRRSVTAALRS